MKNVIYLVIVITLLITGCVLENKSEKPVVHVQPKELNAARYTCFDVAVAMEKSFKEQGLNPDLYFEQNCGTKKEYEDFKAGLFIQKK